jgi:NhaP-type Na+/H+ or K+/H+ antiporter
VPGSILLDITTVIVLGIGAQWVAWRFRLPSILLLLVAGFVAGPVLEVLNPEALQGDWVFAFVSVSIGIILFEGGLSLRLSELREVGAAVRNLITVGVLVTWVLGATAAYYILGFSVSLSVLIGAILTVTGPTVVVPLLRHIRPKGRVGTIAKWEGITIDPVGAILAVLVLEALVLLHEPMTAVEHGGSVAHAFQEVARGLLLEVVVALGVGVAGFAILLVTLSRRLVPDFLRNPVTLMVVVAAFVLSNELQHESGLLTTTLMGIAMANQPYVSVQRIVEFKENLQVLLIGSLFIVLSARLELSALQYVNQEALLFLAILIIVVRPLSVFISAVGTQMKWEEQIFMSWLAPRGIVAAAVASLFAFELQDIFPQEVGALVPIVFLVIVGTVATYGLTAPPLARWLGLAEPNPEGLLFVGAERWVRVVACFVQDLGYHVHLIDSNPEHVESAREEGLQAQRANALSESVLDEVNLSGIGRLLITIPNDEVGSLAALHFSEIFDTTDIYQLAAHPDSRQAGEDEMPKHLRGRPLFGEHTSYETLAARIRSKDDLHLLRVAEDLPGEEKQDYYTREELQEYLPEGIRVIPLFIRRDGALEIVSEDAQFLLRPDDQLVALLQGSADRPSASPPEDVFETVSISELEHEEDETPNEGLSVPMPRNPFASS